ncbi:MAG: hypothetical protein RL213_1353 [Bacteroidota bacterium]|jgi:phosphatidate cytidylyltransferase
MSNLTQRIITAIIGISLVISAVLYSEFTLLLLLTVIALLGTYEFYGLLANDNVRPQVLPGMLMSLVPFVSPLLSSGTGIASNLLPLIIVLPYVIFMRELYRKAAKPFTNVALTLLGPIYLSLPLFLFYLYSFQGIDSGGYNPQNILGFLFILWSNDTGAYFTGRFLGKRKLFERISPKKTWEGFIGGALLAGIIGYTVSRYYTSFDTKTWMVISGIIVVSGTLGDLVESLFKRSIAIKDSGELLPGHGGILDRFDALYISVPFVFVYLLLFG